MIGAVFNDRSMAICHQFLSKKESENVKWGSSSRSKIQFDQSSALISFAFALTRYTHAFLYKPTSFCPAHEQPLQLARVLVRGRQHQKNTYVLNKCGCDQTKYDSVSPALKSPISFQRT